MIWAVIIVVILAVETCLTIPDKLPFLRKRCKK